MGLGIGSQENKRFPVDRGFLGPDSVVKRIITNKVK